LQCAVQGGIVLAMLCPSKHCGGVGAEGGDEQGGAAQTGLGGGDKAQAYLVPGFGDAVFGGVQGGNVGGAAWERGQRADGDKQLVGAGGLAGNLWGRGEYLDGMGDLAHLGG